jgi:hypothetical protein
MVENHKEQNMKVSYGIVVLSDKVYLISDEEIVEGDLGFNNYDNNVWEYKPAPCPIPFWGNKQTMLKLIAKEKDFDFSLVSGQIDFPDIETLSMEAYPFHHEFGTPTWLDSNLIFRNVWKEGFKKCLSKRKTQKTVYFVELEMDGDHPKLINGKYKVLKLK